MELGQAVPQPPVPQGDLGKYNRMFEMYSKIMANSHEMKKSLIANFPR
jgi:hypothetical protein